MNKYISMDPQVCNGKPVVTGTRIPVTVIIDQLASVGTVEGILALYPELTSEQVIAALQYCHSIIDHTEFETAAA